MSHATVFRRLSDMEQRLGVTLFERSRTGYVPTAAGEDLASAGERMQAEVHGVERRVMGRDMRLSGSLRITTTDSLLTGLLSPILAQFGREHPSISLEMALSNQVLNLSERDADIAIRPTQAPPEHLIGRKVGRIEQAVYAGRPYRNELPSEYDPQQVDWIGPDRHFGYRQLDSWMAKQGINDHCRYRVDSLLAMQAAVESGAGVAALPCYLADANERLQRISPPIAELATDLWLLTHPDLRRVARVRALMEFVSPAVRASPIDKSLRAN